MTGGDIMICTCDGSPTPKSFDIVRIIERTNPLAWIFGEELRLPTCRRCGNVITY